MLLQKKIVPALTECEQSAILNTEKSRGVLNMAILLTGGTGYIGSHTAVAGVYHENIQKGRPSLVQFLCAAA